MKFKLASILGSILLFSSISIASGNTGTWSDPGIQWRTRTPFTLALIDKTTTEVWHERVRKVAAEWSAASTADVVIGGKGRISVEVYNVSGSALCGWTHADIQSGYLKRVYIFIDDPCVDRAIGVFPFDYAQLVLCNEVGHALGLPDHRIDDPGEPDCMAPGIHPGPSPTQADFDKLAELYQ